ncbi:hypothetical protein WJX75_002335 [Coccomyxa subellipsoidea]|uniref:DH domain-containing protein n=1 Tax=Coccomyxa subellipsoidea TaxID=248742 RepID=A0ABR2YQ86_9CHLO
MGVEKVIREEHVQDAYREWRCNEWEMDRAGLLSSTECPCCSKEQHSIHSDGNMKLYIYDRNREEFRAPYYDDIFIRDGVVLRHIEALDLALTGQQAPAEAAAQPLVSAAHGKLHSWHCQVLHSPLWRTGAGLGAGSTDTISEVAFDLNLDRILRLPASLRRRHATAIKKAIEAETGYFALCEELLAESHQHGSHAFMDEMHDEVTRVAREHEAREPTELGLRTEYFKSCKQVEEALLLDIMVKGSEPLDTLLAGQDFAELRRQATGIISNLPKYSRKCADLERQLVDRNLLPAERGPAEVEAILRGDFPWIAGMGAGGLSLKSKIKLCEAWNLLQRCREERLLLEKEMRSCFTFWTDKHEAISLRINALQDDIMPTSPDHFAEVEACTYEVSDEAMAATPSLRGAMRSYRGDSTDLQLHQSCSHTWDHTNHSWHRRTDLG